MKCRSRWMVGSATFTIVWSRMFINMARQTTIRAIQRRRSCTKAAREDGMAGSWVTAGFGSIH